MKAIVKKNIVRRLKTAEGQVRALERMVEKDTYCIDLITQLSAARHALSAIEDSVLESHLSTCVVDQMRGGSPQKAVREILVAYRASKKK